MLAVADLPAAVLTPDFMDDELSPLLALAERAVTTRSRIAVLSLWKHLPLVPLFASHLHLKWAGQVESLPLSPRIGIFPFFFDVRFTEAIAHIQIASYMGNSWKITGTLERVGTRPIELARFHYLDGNLKQQVGLLELQREGFPVFAKPGDRFVPERAEHEELWASMNVYWPEMADPIHDAADWALSKDIAILTTAWNQDGWGFGFTGPGTAFGEIGLRTSGGPFWFTGSPNPARNTAFPAKCARRRGGARFTPITNAYFQTI